MPDLAIEIVSPTNKTAEDAAKIEEYFRHGVRKVWLVFPRLRLVHVYSSPTDVRILSKETADVLDGEDILPRFLLPLATLFENEPTADAAE